MSSRHSERLRLKRGANAKRKWEQEKEEASNKLIKAVDEFIHIVNKGEEFGSSNDAIKEIRDLVHIQDPKVIAWEKYYEEVRPYYEEDSSEESGAEEINIDWSSFRPQEVQGPDSESTVHVNFRFPPEAWNPPAYVSPSVAADKPCSRCGCKDERMCLCC